MPHHVCLAWLSDAQLYSDVQLHLRTSQPSSAGSANRLNSSGVPASTNNHGRDASAVSTAAMQSNATSSEPTGSSPQGDGGQAKRKAGGTGGDVGRGSAKTVRIENGGVRRSARAAASAAASAAVATPEALVPTDITTAAGAAPAPAVPEDCDDGTRVYSLHGVTLAKASAYFKTRMEGGSGISMLAYSGLLTAALTGGKAPAPRWEA